MENFIILEYEFPKSKATVYRAAWRMEYLKLNASFAERVPSVQFLFAFTNSHYKRKKYKKRKEKKRER